MSNPLLALRSDEELAINERHRAENKALLEQHGADWTCEKEGESDLAWRALSEAHHLEWAGVAAQRSGDTGKPKVKKDKSRRMLEWAHANPGAIVNADILAAMIDCSPSTAHKFINDNRSLFHDGPVRGMFVVADEAAERAAAKAAKRAGS